MKKLIRSLSFILLILMVISSFSACADTNGDDVATQSSDVAATDTSKASVNAVALDKFTVVYSDGNEERATAVKNAILSSTGYDLEIKSAADGESEYEILIGNVEREATKDFYEYPLRYNAIYRVDVLGKKLALLATTDTTLQLATDDFIGTFFSGEQTALRLTEGTVLKGDVYGDRTVMINRRVNETDIRIGCNNIYVHQHSETEMYSYRKPYLLESFVLMDADVLLIQECGQDKSMSPSKTTWHDEIDADMEKLGYSLVPGQKNKLIPNYTPIWYRADKLELIDHKYHIYDSVKYMPDSYLSWSKSYTRAIFKDKNTGETFACISTHFTWADDKTQAAEKEPLGDELRLSDAKEVAAEVKALKEQYGDDFPIFLAGDLNCTSGSRPYSEISRIMKNVRVAPGVKKNSAGTATGHSLGNPPASGAAIDHTFMSGTGFKATQFQHVLNPNSLKATDHIPLLLDVDFTAN